MRRCLPWVITILFLVGCSRTVPVPTAPATPMGLAPLDGKLYLRLEETSGLIRLKLRTAMIYGVYNNEISAVLSSTQTGRLEIIINGIIHCTACQETVGPARRDIDLGAREGNYRLIFRYLDQSEAFGFSVSSSRITLVPEQQNLFVEPEYLEYQRLPRDAIWIIAHNEGTYDGQGNWQPLERSTYEQSSAQFFAELQDQLHALPFEPIEGHYTNYLFIPPWESWHKPKDGWTKIPLEEGGWYELRWPDIRYYHYGGDWQRIEALLETFKEKGLSLYGFSWSGDRIFAIKKLGGG